MVLVRFWVVVGVSDGSSSFSEVLRDFKGVLGVFQMVLTTSRSSFEEVLSDFQVVL